LKVYGVGGFVVAIPKNKKEKRVRAGARVESLVSKACGPKRVRYHTSMVVP
jgi:hypothetical protein